MLDYGGKVGGISHKSAGEDENKLVREMEE